MRYKLSRHWKGTYSENKDYVKFPSETKVYVKFYSQIKEYAKYPSDTKGYAKFHPETKELVNSLWDQGGTEISLRGFNAVYVQRR
jgi:hypothetical protein